MCGLFGGGSPPPPAPPPPVPVRSDAEAMRHALAERRRRQLARGRQSTILTSGLGVAGPAPGGAKTLLGQ